MTLKEIPDNSWFMTEKKEWFKKIMHEKKENIVWVTQVGKFGDIPMNPNIKVEMLK